jgi:exopolysaccharide production protein ExoQ
MSAHAHRLRMVQIVLGPKALAAAVVVVPLFAVAAPNLLYIPLAIGAGAILFRYVLAPPSLSGAWWGLIAWSAAFVAWLFASASWSLDAGASLYYAGAVLGYAVIGLLVLHQAAELDDAACRIAGISLTVGLLVCVVAAGLVFERDAVTRKLATAAAFTAVAAWPCAAWLWSSRYRVLAILPVIIPVLIGLAFGYAAIVAAMAAGGLVCVAAFLWRRRTAWSLAVILPAMVLLAPLAASKIDAGPWLKSVPDAIEFSLYHRIKIWHFAAARIAERPLAGWGLDASRRIPGGDQTFDINSDLGYERARYESRPKAMPLHPHNNALQIWLELGGVGAILGAVMLAALPLLVLRAGRPAPAHAAALATITTGFVIAMLSFGLWQSRWFPVMWFAAALCVGLARRAPGRVGDAAAPDGS